MHEVLVNRLGGLSLPRKSVVRLTDRPDMTLDVYRGRKTTMQQQCNNYGEHSSRLRNFEGFKLVTTLTETKEAKCKTRYHSLSKAFSKSMKTRYSFCCCFTYNSKVQDLFCGAPSGSEPSMFFGNYLCVIISG